MTTPDASYWRLFNVMLRLLGVGATFSGGVIGYIVGFAPAAPAGGVGSQRLLVLLPGLLLLLLGLGFLLLKPFRPDLGDTGAPLNPFRSSAGRRRWWTGDRV